MVCVVNLYFCLLECLLCFVFVFAKNWWLLLGYMFVFVGCSFLCLFFVGLWLRSLWMLFLVLCMWLVGYDLLRVIDFFGVGLWCVFL